MNRKDYIHSVLSAFSGRKKALIQDELSAHIQDRVDSLVDIGYSPEQAEEIAVGKMGDAELLGARLTKIHSEKTVTDTCFILFFLYIGLSILLTMTFLAWGSAVSFLNLGAEYAYLLLSVVSLLLAARLKSDKPALISLIFTLVLLAGKAVLCFHSVLLYGAFLTICGKADDFIIISQLNNNGITSNVLLVFTILFDLLWILSYVFTFINLCRFDRFKYSKKDISKESIFKKAIAAVLILLTAVTVFLFAFKLCNGYGEYLDGTNDSYYSGIYLIESDEICDIEECYAAAAESPEILYRHLDWGSVDANTEGYRQFSADCTEEKRKFNNAVTYTFYTLSSRYVPSKRYVAAVPVRNVYENLQPCFDGVQWYDTDEVKKISGSLDRDADFVKTTDYAVEICSVDGLNTVDAAEYAMGVLESLRLGYQYLTDEDIKRIEQSINAAYIGNEGSGVQLYHFVMNDKIDVHIAYPERSVIFTYKDEFIAETKLRNGYVQIYSY